LRFIIFLATLAALAAPDAVLADPSSVYFFGDSLTDEGRAGQTAPVMWPSVYLAATGIGASVNYAIGGAYTSNQPSAEFGDMSFLGQVNAFVAAGSAAGPNPAAGIWIGTNNIWIQSGQGAAPASIATRAAADVATGIKTLVGDGVHQFLLLGVYDLSLTNAYYLAGDSTLATRAAAAAASQQYNAQLASLSTPGAAIQYFNIANFINHLMTNPQAYGFTTILPLMPGQACNAACEQTSIFTDTIHLTSKTQTLIGDYVASGNPVYNTANFTYGAIAANVESATASAPLPAEMALSSSQEFVNSEFDRLEASRWAPELPGSSPWSVYGAGDFAAVSPARVGVLAGYGNSNMDYYSASASIGVQYRARPGLRVGASFDYSRAESDLNQTLGSKTSADAYQGAIWASYSRRELFADAILAAGAERFDQTRLGTFGQVSGSPGGGTFTAAARAGYLFETGPVRIGPVAGFAYSRASLNGYTEAGALASAMAYGAQASVSEIGSGGVEIRPAARLAWGLDPFLLAAYEHQFASQAQSVPVAFAYLPTQTLPSWVDAPGDAIRLTAGASFELGRGWSGMVSAYGLIGLKDYGGFGARASATYRF
jgi:uncharacterized protein YhjY with autotransporter beta-barrel domain/phospholipase/lecithinase/hemolysin